MTHTDNHQPNQERIISPEREAHLTRIAIDLDAVSSGMAVVEHTRPEAAGLVSVHLTEEQPDMSDTVIHDTLDQDEVSAAFRLKQARINAIQAFRDAA